MGKFSEWFGRNRKPIGYTVGGLNIGAGIGYLLTGIPGMGIVWIVIGTMIVFDTYEYK